MKVKDFKSELRMLLPSDEWGEAMSAFFECAGQMNKRGLFIPYEWSYSPGMGSDGTDEDSYWFELFEDAIDDNLILIGDLLHRYTNYLDYKGLSY